MTSKTRFDIILDLLHLSFMSKASETTKKSAKTRASGRKRESASAKRKATKASTVRLDPNLQTALDTISGNLGKTKNRIFNEALADYLEKSGIQLRDDIEGTLQGLRAYRRKDPDFDADIERFALAESKHSSDDAHEGKLQSQPHHSLSDEIQELIHA